MLRYIKRLLGMKKEYPTMKYRVNIIKEFYKFFAEDVHKTNKLGILEASGKNPSSKHLRNCMLLTAAGSLKLNTDVLSNTVQLTCTGSEVSKGYIIEKGQMDFIPGSLEDLLPFLLAYDTTNNDLLEESVSRISSSNLVGSDIHALAINSVLEKHKFAPLSNYTVNNKIKNNSTVYDMIALYLLARTDTKYIKKFNKLFQRDEDNNLFPAILAYNLGLLNRSELKGFISKHYIDFNNKKMDNYNFIIALSFIYGKLDYIFGEKNGK